MGDALGLGVVLVSAAGVAAIVYVLASRRPGPSGEDGWSIDDPPGEPAFIDPPGSGAYLPVVSSRTSWRGRVTGLVGLLVAVTAGAIALAAGLYALGSFVAHLLSSAVHSGG